jgi:uncharacterized membrane protein YhdT
MNLLPVFEWLEATAPGEMVRQSLWLFPVIEAFHLVAFAVLGGTVLLTDLRLLGLAMRTQPTAHIAREARPWLLGSLVVMIISGVLLFLSEAIKCYYSFPFKVKITCLFLAIIFTWTLHKRVAMTDDAAIGPIKGRVAAVISLGLWGAVAWGGRWIGFSG